MSNPLSEQLAVLSLDSFSQGGLRFYLLCRLCLVTGANSFISLKLVIPISSLKVKQMVSLSQPLLLWPELIGSFHSQRISYILVRQ